MRLTVDELKKKLKDLNKFDNHKYSLENMIEQNIKNKVYKDIPKHSAYRSGILVKKYKEAYKKKHNSHDAYEGKKKDKEGLSRWFKEEWRNQRGEVGYKKKGDVYRPTKKITKETPVRFVDLSKEQIKKSVLEKKKIGRVNNFSNL